MVELFQQSLKKCNPEHLLRGGIIFNEILLAEDEF